MVTRLFLLSALPFLLSACSAAKFSTSKQDALSKNSVFGEDGAAVDPDDPNGPGGRVPSGEPRDDEDDVGVDAVTVTLMCSDNRSANDTNFKRAIALGLPVQLKIGNAVCTSNPNVIQNLIVKTAITRADLLAICQPIVPAGPLAVSVVINGSVNATKNGKMTVLYARNTDESVPSEAADTNCDKKSSPLVIHMASDIVNPLPIALSSQEDGVDFDLLGANGGYQKLRLSWFTNNDYRFLALPDSRGQVRGIDQLFGDNTAGPDGAFADNGYAALAKYDGMTSDGMFRVASADGRIDKNDAIFKVAFVVGQNRDGLSDRGELTSLSRARMSYIDLEFSTDYAEVDRFGNETKMKSVVGYEDGSLDLIFDLWFAYNLPE